MEKSGDKGGPSRDGWDSEEYDTDIEEAQDISEAEEQQGGSPQHRSPASAAASAAASVLDSDGLLAYSLACEELQITPAQRVLGGLTGAELQLKYRSLGPVGAKALAAALVTNTKVEILNLEENGLEGEGGTYIGNMLKENNFITNVNLSKNRLGSWGAQAIGEMLKINNGITHLNLSDNHLKDSDAELLATGIEKNERVIHLDLSHNAFSEEGAMQLGRAVGNNNSIENLNLSWNQVRRKGAVTICNSLKRNYCITCLNLAWNGFGYEGSLAVGEMLRGNKYLRELDISNNRINWEGALLISRGLKENDTLEYFEIGWNPLTMTGCLDVLEACDNPLSVVSYLGLTGIPVNRKVMYMMEGVQKLRKFRLVHGGLLESEDIFGRRMVLRCDPLKLLIQYLSDKGIRPVDLFRTFDKDNQHRVSREQFIQGLKKAKVPLDDYEMERVLNRLDSAKEGKISYQRLMRGVKEQIKVNREEERKRQLEEQKNNTDHAKIIETSTDPFSTNDPLNPNDPLPAIEEDTSSSRPSPTDQTTSKNQSPLQYRAGRIVSTSSRDSGRSQYANLSTMGQRSFISMAKAAGLTEDRPVTASSMASLSTGRTLVGGTLRSIDSAARRSRASLRAATGTPTSLFSQRAGVSEAEIRLDAPLASRELIVREENIQKTLTPPKQKHHHHPPNSSIDVDNQIITEIQKEDMRKKKKTGKH